MPFGLFETASATAAGRPLYRGETALLNKNGGAIDLGIIAGGELAFLIEVDAN